MTSAVNHCHFVSFLHIILSVCHISLIRSVCHKYDAQLHFGAPFNVPSHVQGFEMITFIIYSNCNATRLQRIFVSERKVIETITD